MQTEQRQIKDHLKSAETRISKASADIEKEYQRLGDENGGIHAMRRAELEEKRVALAAARTRLEDHENSVGALETDRRHAEMDLKESQLPIGPKRSEVQQCENQLNELIKDRGQRQGAYHPNMPRLLDAIRQDEGFSQKPVGPLGNQVRLLKPLWSSILEKSFGATLNSFIVTSKHDQSRLSNLMQRCGL